MYSISKSSFQRNFANLKNYIPKSLDYFFYKNKFSINAMTIFKRTFFQKYTNINNKNLNNQITKKICKNFTSENVKGNEIKVYLSDTEAYYINEHDRSILLLDSNSVSKSSLAKFMKELLDHCYYLSKYYSNMKG